MKRIITMIICSCLILSLFVGCKKSNIIYPSGNGNPTSGSNAPTSAVDDFCEPSSAALGTTESNDAEPSENTIVTVPPIENETLMENPSSESGVVGSDPISSAETEVPEETEDPAVLRRIKVGLICLSDENDQSNTYNFIRGMTDADRILKDKGIEVDWIVEYNVPEGSECEDVNAELAMLGCELILNTSYGHEPYMLNAAQDYPEVQFVSCTGDKSWNDNLENTHNAYADIYEGRYLAGVVGGMKLQELIDNGTIQPEEAKVGFIGTFDFSEVTSSYTAYFLGVRSVCPSASMNVQFSLSWSDAYAEEQAAAALCDEGCKLISQYAESANPAIVAQNNGVFFTSFNYDRIETAPDAVLTGTRIDWSAYFVEAIEALCQGEPISQDWSGGVSDGAVALLPINDMIAAPGTADKVREVAAKLQDGSLQVFDISTFTVNGEHLTHAFAVDTDGDWVPDAGECVKDGAFLESDIQSYPYFAFLIDGITLLNSGY